MKSGIEHGNHRYARQQSLTGIDTTQVMGIVQRCEIDTPADLGDGFVKKGGAFASQSVGGLSGAFIPVCEDRELAAAVAEGSLSLEKLEAMTSVCSVGLDMVAVPGALDAATLSALIADEMAIGMVNGKTTAVRIIPVPGKEAGEVVVFGGLFGESAILPVRNPGASSRFIGFGGKIPAPIHSLKN